MIVRQSHVALLLERELLPPPNSTTPAMSPPQILTLPSAELVIELQRRDPAAVCSVHVLLAELYV